MYVSTLNNRRYARDHDVMYLYRDKIFKIETSLEFHSYACIIAQENYNGHDSMFVHLWCCPPL